MKAKEYIKKFKELVKSDDRMNEEIDMLDILDDSATIGIEDASKLYYYLTKKKIEENKKRRKKVMKIKPLT
jgi:hypothetical protein